MYADNALMAELLKAVGVTDASELYAQTGDKALDMVNRRIALDLFTIDSAQSRALTAAAKLAGEQKSFVEKITAGRYDDASWLVNYAREVADRMAEIQAARDNVLAAIPLRLALQNRPS